MVGWLVVDLRFTGKPMVGFIGRRLTCDSWPSVGLLRGRLTVRLLAYPAGPGHQKARPGLNCPKSPRAGRTVETPTLVSGTFDLSSRLPLAVSGNMLAGLKGISGWGRALLK